MKHTHPLLTLPGSPGEAHAMAAALIERNHSQFGDLRMGPDDPPADDAPDDPPKGGGGDDPPEVNEHGFPDKTPVEKMTAEQQAAYHKHHSRKWEQRAKSREDYDQQKADADKWRQAQLDQLPADQKALEEAREQAAQAARTEERGKYGRQLVQAELRGALRGRQVTQERVEAIVGPLDYNYFLTDSGEVDTDKVSSYASGFGQDGGQWPDTGQGNRGGHEPSKGVGAGRDLYAERRKK